MTAARLEQVDATARVARDVNAGIAVGVAAAMVDLRDRIVTRASELVGFSDLR